MTARSARDRVALRLPLPAGPAIDPYALAGGSGVLLAAEGRLRVGLGAAATLDLPDGLTSVGDLDRLLEALGAIRCDDRLGQPAATTAGHAVRAFGALPFDRAAATGLTVPALLYGLEPDGSEWVTLVADAPGGLPDPDSDPDVGDRLRARLLGVASRHRPEVAATDDRTAGAARIELRCSDDDFRSAVAAAVTAIDRGELAKVVLARQAEVTLPRPIDVTGLLRRWGALEPTCTLFSLPTPAGQFVGASPELLVDRVGERFRCVPLAGTTGGPDSGAHGLPPELLESTKDAEEHRLVVEGVLDALAPLSIHIDAPERPDLVHLHNMTHLGSAITGTLAAADGPRGGDRGGPPSALHLVAALHPTPAVGGVPTDAALDAISRLEPDGRDVYAGPVGSVDAAGDGRWVVGIRAVTVDGPGARMVAGVGVVRGSHPDAELVETTLKFTAVFDAVAPGQPFSTSITLPGSGGRTSPAAVG